ncbi:hypothetical protein BH09PAT2_BH09PAT2_01140 [soil metagenome]
MAGDKYAAIWVSHTSISDFSKCPRSYFLKNIYKDPKTNRKIKLMSPPLALGQAIHEVIDSVSVLPVEKRFSEMFMNRFERAWENVKGKKGGFASDDSEAIYKAQGREMIARLTKHPGPLARKAVKIKQDLPNSWLSEEDNIILCGRVDWLEYLPETDTVHIIDFKTGKNDEDANSLQLPIYYVLVSNCQHRRVSKISYWYLERNDDLTEMPLPDAAEANAKILDIARQIKVARQLERFKCPTDGCRNCKPFEDIIEGKAEFVYVDSYNSDVYILDSSSENIEDMSEIL